MYLLHSIVLIYALLEVSISMRNFHIPHGYFHSLAMQHDNYEQDHYDTSYDSDSVVVRSHRKKYYRNRVNDYSEAHTYKRQCKCSCPKCKNGKSKLCCRDFCASQCTMPNSIVVVPYPMPFIVQPITNQSSAPTTATTTMTTTTPESRPTLPSTYSTAAYYLPRTALPPSIKRFHIIQDKKLRRNMGHNGIRPAKFERLPKYGIVPIPENLAISLMQQIRNDQKNDQLRKRLLDYDQTFK